MRWGAPSGKDVAEETRKNRDSKNGDTSANVGWVLPPGASADRFRTPSVLSIPLSSIGRPHKLCFAFFAVAVLAAIGAVFAAELLPDDSCVQPSPQEMAKAAGVTLPKLPWHVVNIWWDFDKPTAHFDSLSVDVTIDRDVPPTYNLYISPCGLGKMNGQQFYGGLQSNINGWANATNHTRVHPGKGAIFSRWSSDKKTPIGLEHVRVAGPDCLVESAGYEGEFASVRRPFAWTKGTYTWEIVKDRTEAIDTQTNTWFRCQVKASNGATFPVGSLRFEGSDFSFWEKNSAFVEVYSTSKIPRSGIPKVNITFGWPRLNGQPAVLKRASAYYPSKTGPAAPDCAVAKAAGSDVRVEVGPIFQRDEEQRRHGLSITNDVSLKP